MTGLVRHIIRYVKDDRATATMEFVIMFPVVILLFIAAFETGMILSRQVLLERSLDDAVRSLRLLRTTEDSDGVKDPWTDDHIQDAICRNTRSIPNCHDVLVVELTVIDDDTYEIPAADAVCVDRNNSSVAPANTFDPGEDSDLMLIRTCAVVDRILPFSGFGLNLVRDDTGGIHMVASSVFMNEP